MLVEVPVPKAGAAGPVARPHRQREAGGRLEVLAAPGVGDRAGGRADREHAARVADDDRVGDRVAFIGVGRRDRAHVDGRRAAVGVLRQGGGVARLAVREGEHRQMVVGRRLPRARIRPVAVARGVGRAHLHLVLGARLEAGDGRGRGGHVLRTVRPVPAGAYPVLQVVAGDGRPGVGRRAPAHVEARGRARCCGHRRRRRLARHRVGERVELDGVRRRAVEGVAHLLRAGEHPHLLEGLRGQAGDGVRGGARPGVVSPDLRVPAVVGRVAVVGVDAEAGDGPCGRLRRLGPLHPDAVVGDLIHRHPGHLAGRVRHRDDRGQAVEGIGGAVWPDGATISDSDV